MEVPVGLERVVAMFRWWNETVSDRQGFTPEGFGRHFTEDGVLVVNGETRAAGLDGLAAHFERIRTSLDQVSIVLPLAHGFDSDDHTFVHYRVKAVANGTPAAEEAMGFVRCQDGRIAEMNVLSRDMA